MKDAKGILIVVGGAIGAGFISGAELVRFFYARTFFFAVVLSSLLFAYFAYALLKMGGRYGGYVPATERLFPRSARWIRLSLAAVSLVPCAGMLAGLDALLPAYAPLLSCLGIFASLLVLRRGMKGISLVNLILVPVLLLFVFAHAAWGESLGFATQTSNLFGGILYAGMNTLLLAPVLLETGREIAHPAAVSGAAGAIVAVAAIAVLSSVVGGGEEAVRAEMPFLYVMRGRTAFSVMVALAIFTSLASSLYALLAVARGVSGKKKYAVKGGLLLTAFLLSRLGLKGIVGILYPLEGCLGVLFSVVCILDQRLLEKHHEKVHAGGKHAEDGRRAHHEVELKDLPAVHDEIAEPRP